MSPKENLFISGIKKDVGSKHPIEEMKNKLVNIMESFGFNYEEGPEIETEENNFDMLNIKKNHPARQMHDTFYVENRSFVLRTHTSPVQIRSMLKLNPPISIVSAGKVYRKDDDSTHLPMFHQVEAICVDQGINFANLKYLIYEICSILFGSEVEIRFRPSYFPFTEPSAEVDIKSENGKWLEILGCGIVNPIVLDNCNINSSKFSGLALGMGVERIAMLLNNVSDIRDFYKSNLDFLEQNK
ncbi:MAG: phenylalanine--tRNA ligase subunit alpha [Gammaproteobacteria bacterium]